MKRKLPDSAHAKYARKREQQLPKWAHGLPVRAQNALLNELRSGAVPDLRRTTVRKHGEMMWMRVPNCGRKTTTDIANAIGGWRR